MVKSQSMKLSYVVYIHPSTKYLMSIYYVSGIMCQDLVAKNKSWNKTDNIPCPYRIYMLVS